MRIRHRSPPASVGKRQPGHDSAGVDQPASKRTPGRFIGRRAPQSDAVSAEQAALSHRHRPRERNPALIG